MIENIKNLIIKYKRFITFSFIGGINSLVDFTAFTLAHSLTAMPEEYSQAVGYTAGLLCSFILNHRVTFRDGERSRLAGTVIRFICVNAVSMGFSMIAIRQLVDMGLNAYIAKIIITLGVGIINYLGYKIIVFRVKDKGGV